MLGACTYVLGPHELIDGEAFPVESLGEVEKGMSPEDVENLLGPAWRKKKQPGGERWIYLSRYQHRSCNVYLLGFVPIERRPKDRFEAKIDFGLEGLRRAHLVKMLAGERQVVEIVEPTGDG